MDITVENKPECQAALKAVVSADDTASRRNVIIQSYANHAKLPGFRPGKVPFSIIAKRFKNEIAEELRNDLFEAACAEALQKDLDLRVLSFGKPEFNSQEDGSMVITTTMTIVPHFEIPEYKGLEIDALSDEVTDAEVDEALNNIARNFSDFEPVERESKEGDTVVIDFKTTLNGVPTAEAVGKPVGFLEGRNDHWMRLQDDRFVPGLAAGLTGLKAGDTKEVTVTMPDTFPITDLRGKDVTFNVTIKEVREQIIPAVDEALVARIMPDTTLEQFKTMQKNDLVRRKKLENDNARADQITEMLAEKIDFDIPEQLIENETYNVKYQIIQDMFEEGKVSSPEDLEPLKESIDADAKKDARRNLQVYFLLLEIARLENINVSEQELYMEIMKQAQYARQNPKTFVKQLQKEGRIQGIRMSILTAKTLDFLVKNAKVKEAEAPAVETSTETSADEAPTTEAPTAKTETDNRDK